MGNFVAGPVLRFSVDESSLLQSVQAMIAKVNAQVQASNRQTSQQLTAQAVNPLIQQAAQLRALYSTGSIAAKDLQTQQKTLINLLDTQIKQLAVQDSLTKSQLSTLKALTLERERQQNALSRGIGVGTTAGTQSALALASGPIVANISRLGAGLIGLAGGSGLETTAFNAAAGGIASIAAEGGVATAVLGGFATALLAAGTAATALAISGGALAERLSNISQRTGISIKDLQVLEAVARTSELSLEDIVTGFRKFSQALTGGGGGEAGGFEGAGKKSAEVLQILGVTSKDSFTAIEQVADAFQKLPDGPTKSAAAIELFGRSGLQLIPILNKGKDGIEEYRAIVEQLGPTITQKAVASQDEWQKSTERLRQSFDNLKVSAIPILDKFLTPATNFLSNGIPALGDFGKALSGDFSAEGAAAAQTTPQLNGLAQGLDAAGKAAAGMKKQLDDLLSGKQDEARKKFADFVKQLTENAKQFEQTQIARGATAQTLIGGILSRPLPGTSEGGLLIAQTQDEIKKVQEAVIGLPGLAADAQRAIDRLNSDLFAKLTQMEQDAAEKASETVNEILEKDAAKRTEIINIIRKAQDQAAIDAADANKNAVAKILAEAKKQYDEQAAQLKAQGANYQDFANLRVAIEQDAQAKIAKARQDEIDKTNAEIKNQAGQLFDSLVSGSGNFTQALKKSLLTFTLTPVKLAFEAIAGAIFTPIVQHTKDALKSLGDSIKGHGGILGAIGKELSPDSAIGDNTQKVKLNTDSTDRNTDALNDLTGALTGQKSGAAGNAGSVSGAGSVLFGTILGGVVGKSGGLIFNNQAQGGANLGGLLNSLGPAAALLNIVSGASSRNPGQVIGGGISLLGAQLSKIGAGIPGPNGQPLPGTNNPSLQKLGGILGGSGLVISGVSKGGLGGAASAALGGAEIGTAILPGIGTAIGAIAGFAAGLFGGLFGHHGPTQAQINAAIRRQTVSGNQAASVEFDRAAQSTFAQTLNTTFSEGPGGTFSNAFLNGPRQAPVSNVNFTVHAIDAKGVSDFFATYGRHVAATVAGQVGSTQTGMALAIRKAVSPA